MSEDVKCTLMHNIDDFPLFTEQSIIWHCHNCNVVVRKHPCEHCSNSMNLSKGDHFLSQEVCNKMGYLN